MTTLDLEAMRLGPRKTRKHKTSLKTSSILNIQARMRSRIAALAAASLSFSFADCVPIDARRQAAVAHELKATNKTVHWGYFSKKVAPALTIKSGDTVKVEMVSVSTLQCLPVAVAQSNSGAHTANSPTLDVAAPCWRQSRFDDHRRQGDRGNLQVGSNRAGHHARGFFCVLVSVHERAHGHLLLIKLDGVRCARPRPPFTMAMGHVCCPFCRRQCAE
jgi:hypothetical protein